MSSSIFVRFEPNEKSAQDSLERGFSFDSYNMHDTLEDLLEFEGCTIHGQDGQDVYDYDGNHLGRLDDVITSRDIARDPRTGMWGYKLNGLAGFGEFETVEEAVAAVNSGEIHYDGGNLIVVFRGKYVHDPRVWEKGGCCFVPEEIVLFIHRKKLLPL